MDRLDCCSLQFANAAADSSHGKVRKCCNSYSFSPPASTHRCLRETATSSTKKSETVL